eukprot:6461150-Amphidinium_carterae.1
MPQYRGAALDAWTLTRPHKTIRTTLALKPPRTLVNVPATHAPDVTTLEYGPCLPDPETQPIWEEGHIPEVPLAQHLASKHEARTPVELR